MANRILTQIDSVAGCGTVVGCSGGALAMVPQAREATKDGTPGVGELTVQILRLATQAGVMFQSADNEPGKATWDAGDWVVRLNVTTVQEYINWVASYVCRFNNACGSLATVGSLTGQSISLGTAGVKQMTVAGAEQSANLSDEIYIVLIFTSTSSHVDKIFGFIPDQNIDTPIVLEGATPKSVSDSGSGAESVGVKVKASLSDSGGGADDIVELKALLALADSGFGADALTVNQFRDVAESGIGTEEAKAGTSLSILDSGFGAEAPSVLSKSILQDFGLGTEELLILSKLLMQDSGAGTDGISVSTPTTQKEVQDSGLGQDALAVKAILNILDDALGADSLMVKQFRIVSESGAGVDALAAKNLLALSDSGLGSEALSIISKVQAVQDAGLAVEILAVLSKVGVQDLAAGIDDAIAKMIAGRFVSDEGVGSDMVSALLRTYYPLPFEAEARERAFDAEQRRRTSDAKGRYKK